MAKKNQFAGLLFLFFVGMAAGAQDFTLRYRCAQPETEFNKIKPQFILVNNTDQAVSMHDFTIRYYFSAEGYVESVLSIDYAAVGNGAITSSFHSRYLEIGFSSSAGQIPAGGDSGQIQLRLEKESHGFYIQSNDYSFDPTLSEWGENRKVTCYRSGKLIWGNEPPPGPTPTAPPPADDDWLHTRGNRIVDASGNPVRLTGINWFGFETNPRGLGGLQAINWMETLDMLSGKGFNLLRLPLSLEIVMDWMAGRDPSVNFVSGELNPTIDGVSSLRLLDHLIEYCKVVGLKIMFDMHTLTQTDIQKKVWYNSSTSLAAYQGAWEWLAGRYRDDDTVIAMDIFNEPHGQSWVDGSGGAKWDGSHDPNNWRQAAADTALKILAINPQLLIMVEGVECTPVEGAAYGSTDKYDYLCNWWGGNLREVRNYPVKLGSHQDQLVYSPHDYGPDIHVQPWFKGSFNQERLVNECWRPNWFYIAEEEIAPILVGEWGGRLDNADNRLWLEYLADFLADNELNHTFWCFNPDSHDTGGIVKDDYTFETTKYNLIRPSLWQDEHGRFIGLDHAVPLSGTEAGTNITEFYGGVLPTPGPTVTPDPQPVWGDVNGSGDVNIVDALMTAQACVGLAMPAGFNSDVADVNCNGRLEITDALMIAQFSVDILPELGC